MLTSTEYIVLFLACAATVAPIKLKNTGLEYADALASISFFSFWAEGGAIFVSLHFN